MHVLYATDGSDAARDGERLIASLFDPALDVHVLSVTPIGVYPPESLDLHYDVTRPMTSYQIATETAERLRGGGFRTTWRSTRGNPAEEILRVSRDGPYDLVVVGASHTSWLGNLLLGSVSTPVLHHAPCSVLVTHRAPTGSGRVLLGMDGSSPARDGLRFAAQLLDKQRCSFCVASVVPRPRMVPAAERLVEGACRDLSGAGFDAEGDVLIGQPGPQLLKEADNISADLVVVGSRGLGAMKRTFMGSVSDQVARHSPAALVGRRRERSR